jgi:hypothetical protein
VWIHHLQYSKASSLAAAVFLCAACTVLYSWHVAPVVPMNSSIRPVQRDNDQFQKESKNAAKENERNEGNNQRKKKESKKARKKERKKERNRERRKRERKRESNKGKINERNKQTKKTRKKHTN